MVQSAFPITVKTNTNAIVFPATQEDTVRQVRDMVKIEYLLPMSRGNPENGFITARFKRRTFHEPNLIERSTFESIKFDSLGRPEN